MSTSYHQLVNLINSILSSADSTGSHNRDLTSNGPFLADSIATEICNRFDLTPMTNGNDGGEHTADSDADCHLTTYIYDEYRQLINTTRIK